MQTHLRVQVIQSSFGKIKFSPWIAKIYYACNVCFGVIVYWSSPFLSMLLCYRGILPAIDLIGDHVIIGVSWAVLCYLFSRSLSWLDKVEVALSYWNNAIILLWLIHRFLWLIIFQYLLIVFACHIFLHGVNRCAAWI